MEVITKQMREAAQGNTTIPNGRHGDGVKATTVYEVEKPSSRNGYELDTLTAQFNPLMRFYFDSIMENAGKSANEGKLQTVVTNTMSLDLSQVIPPDIVEAMGLTIHPSVYFDITIHRWGENNGMKDKYVDPAMEATTIGKSDDPNFNPFIYKQEGLVLISHSEPLVKIPIITHGTSHGSGRYSAIGISKEGDFALNAAIFLTAVQTTMNIYSKPEELKQAIPHYQYLPPNNRS